MPPNNIGDASVSEDAVFCAIVAQTKDEFKQELQELSIEQSRSRLHELSALRERFRAEGARGLGDQVFTAANSLGHRVDGFKMCYLHLTAMEKILWGYLRYTMSTAEMFLSSLESIDNDIENWIQILAGANPEYEPDAVRLLDQIKQYKTTIDGLNPERQRVDELLAGIEKTKVAIKEHTKRLAGAPDSENDEDDEEDKDDDEQDHSSESEESDPDADDDALALIYLEQYIGENRGDAAHLTTDTAFKFLRLQRDLDTLDDDTIHHLADCLRVAAEAHFRHPSAAKGPSTVQASSTEHGGSAAQVASTVHGQSSAQNSRTTHGSSTAQVTRTGQSPLAVQAPSHAPAAARPPVSSQQFESTPRSSTAEASMPEHFHSQPSAVVQSIEQARLPVPSQSVVTTQISPPAHLQKSVQPLTPSEYTTSAQHSTVAQPSSSFRPIGAVQHSASTQLGVPAQPSAPRHQYAPYRIHDEDRPAFILMGEWQRLGRDERHFSNPRVIFDWIRSLPNHREFPDIEVQNLACRIQHLHDRLGPGPSPLPAETSELAGADGSFDDLFNQGDLMRDESEN